MGTSLRRRTASVANAWARPVGEPVDAARVDVELDAGARDVGAQPGVALIAPAILLAAFLLFLVQPLIASYILPWFGGSSAVWTTAMLFFQVALVAGYGYAHLSASLLGLQSQTALHAGLLLVAVALLPITPSEVWQPGDAGDPSLRILLLLAANVGLPFVLLASTSPLLQAWLHRLRPGVVPYRLYALGNAGSMVALLAYPFAIEPLLGRADRATLWSGGFALFALLSAACALAAWRSHDAPRIDHAEPRKTHAGEAAAKAATAGDRAMWLLLSATPSLLLLAVTQQITQDVAAIPFLWVVPFVVYLLSFTLIFEGARWYRRAILLPALVPAMGGALWLLDVAGGASIGTQLLGWGAILFVCCMVCHGELARTKPHPRQLTGFYLTLAVGGAVGGASAALIAPLVFDLYLELHWGLLLTCVLGVVALARDERSLLKRLPYSLLWGPVLLGLAVFGFGLRGDIARSRADALEIVRSFYGVLRVNRYATATPYEAKALIHGRTSHGLQFTAPNRRRWPTLYYSWNSGAGLAFRYHVPERARRIGVVGMGAGTLAFYGRPGDEIRFYEIDPAVVEIAERHFSFSGDSGAEVAVVVGDARTSLENESPNGFDLLFLDAFSSDSIPVHLLTREAFALYARHLNPNGVIAANISNAHLDLEPLLRGQAAEIGMRAVVVDAEADGVRGVERSRWMLLTSDAHFLGQPAIAAAVSPATPQASVVWSDDHANVLGALRILSD
jgi:hypothetical protein